MNQFIYANKINYNVINTLTININHLTLIYIIAYIIIQLMELIYKFCLFIINYLIYKNYITYFKLYNDNNLEYKTKIEDEEYYYEDEEEYQEDNYMFKYLYTSIHKYNYSYLTFLINQKSLNKIPKILKNEQCLNEIDRYVYAIIMRLTTLALRKGTNIHYFMKALEMLNINIETDRFIYRNKKEIIKEYAAFIKNKNNLYNLSLYSILNE
jgi:hypothetical protein